jgi:carbon storage regulator
VLVLTRRANQSIMIGQDIVVTVLEVRGDQVRIGIKAPRDIDVHREEVFDALQHASQAPAAASEGGAGGLDQPAPAGVGTPAPGENGKGPAKPTPGRAAAARRE